VAAASADTGDKKTVKRWRSAPVPARSNFRRGMGIEIYTALRSD